MWRIEESCGVLVYINLADHKIELVADHMAERLIDAQKWQKACDNMTQGFARRTFCDSTVAGLEHMNALLGRHFPQRENASTG